MYLQKLNGCAVITPGRKQKGLKPVGLHIIKPQYPLPLDPDFLYNKINADTLINMGYADTREYLANGRMFGSDEAVYNSTAMVTADASLHFRQQFKGRININHSQVAVAIQLSFFLREVKGEFVFQQYSSISLNQGDFISGYNNVIKCNSGAKIEGSFQFYFNSVSYTATVKMQLHSVTDFLIGIDNKTAQVSIGTDGFTGSEFVFIQPAVNRIKNAFYLNVNVDAGWFAKLKWKIRLLSKLFKPGI